MTEPGSGIARPRFANGLVVSYGKRLPSTVVGASGSFFSRKSSQARFPARLPKRLTNACSSWAERSSEPPPRPKMPPISDAVAITSVTDHCCGVLPSAAYSAGRRVGFVSAGGRCRR